MFIALGDVHPASDNVSSKLRWKEHMKNNEKASKYEEIFFSVKRGLANSNNNSIWTKFRLFELNLLFTCRSRLTQDTDLDWITPNDKAYGFLNDGIFGVSFEIYRCDSNALRLVNENFTGN